MNLELLDPWAQEYPQVIEETLEDGYMSNCRFNRYGTLLAAGCLDGRCVVWDFDTKGVARNLSGHVRPVSSVSWSRNGRYLLSSSKDWTCILWDLITGTKFSKVRFDTAVLMSQMHPRSSFQFIAALYQEKPVLVDLTDGHVKQTVLPVQVDEVVSGKIETYVTAVAWNKTGSRVFAGTSKGHLLVIDPHIPSVVHTSRITSTTIKGIQLSRNGRDMLVNASDRIIRSFHLEDHEAIPTLQNKFQDLVNRIQWNQACFSPDGEFVIGAEHNICIWDKRKGNLVKILEGPKESLDDIAWHPLRPVIASVGSYGNAHIWATKHEENWSAFAPDFTELEENLEYDEREDEFDIVPAEEVSKRKHDDEDITVDVTTCEAIQAFLDSDDEGANDDKTRSRENGVIYLPAIPSDENDQDNATTADHAVPSDDLPQSTQPTKKLKRAAEPAAIL